MGMLDFIKNRGSRQQPPEQAKPETAKQMYTREAAQEKPSARAINDLSAGDKASLSKAQELFAKGTRQAQESPAMPAPQAEGATAPQPMAQMSMNQDKSAPALSPTSAQQGTRAHEQESPASAKQNPSPSQEQAKPTMARRPPSWER
jgi:hypothetical protein